MIRLLAIGALALGVAVLLLAWLLAYLQTWWMRRRPDPSWRASKVTQRFAGHDEQLEVRARRRREKAQRITRKARQMESSPASKPAEPGRILRMPKAGRR